MGNKPGIIEGISFGKPGCMIRIERLYPIAVFVLRTYKAGLRIKQIRPIIRTFIKQFKVIGLSQHFSHLSQTPVVVSILHRIGDSSFPCGNIPILHIRNQVLNSDSSTTFILLRRCCHHLFQTVIRNIQVKVTYTALPGSQYLRDRMHGNHHTGMFYPGRIRIEPTAILIKLNSRTCPLAGYFRSYQIE